MGRGTLGGNSDRGMNHCRLLQEILLGEGEGVVEEEAGALMVALDLDLSVVAGVVHELADASKWPVL